MVCTPLHAVSRIQGFAPSIILTGRNPQTGDVQIGVDSPGVRSRTRLSSNGLVSLDVRGAKGIGREGERQLAETLRTKLQQEGVSARVSAGQDNRGEDAIFNANGHTLVVQAVTAPAESEFWFEASAGLASRQVDSPDVVQLLRRAILDKVRKYPLSQRANILLAIDARHAGVLASKPVVDGYLGRYGSPGVEFGFASVWVVGPTGEYCCRLGAGAL